jgi:hypothetical protein
LQELAENDHEKNKYHLGKSSGLVEIVEFLFIKMLDPVKYKGQEINQQTMNNKVIDACSYSLLKWLREALPYHAEPAYMKRYLKIVTHLVYSIRESEPVNHENNQENSIEGTHSCRGTHDYITI